MQEKCISQKIENILDRKSKIRRLFNTEVSNHTLFTFDDSTENLILPRVKIERYQIGKKYVYEMFRTTSDIMMPLEDWLIDFALDNGLKSLSDAMCYTHAVTKLEKTRRKKAKSEDEQERRLKEILNLTSKIKKLKLKTTINLNQIKDNYETRILQEVSKSNLPDAKN